MRRETRGGGGGGGRAHMNPGDPARARASHPVAGQRRRSFNFYLSQTDGQTDRETERQTDRQTEAGTCYCPHTAAPSAGVDSK